MLDSCKLFLTLNPLSPMCQYIDTVVKPVFCTVDTIIANSKKFNFRAYSYTVDLQWLNEPVNCFRNKENKYNGRNQAISTD